MKMKVCAPIPSPEILARIIKNSQAFGFLV
jgi:hypothetical protein